MLELDEITPEKIPNVKIRIIKYEKIILSELRKKEKKIYNSYDAHCMVVDYNILKKLKSGEIITDFTQKYLKGQINIAIQTLLVAMLTILPFVEFWDLTFVFVLIYFYKLKKYKNEALEYDRKKIATMYVNKNDELYNNSL